MVSLYTLHINKVAPPLFDNHEIPVSMPTMLVLCASWFGCNEHHNTEWLFFFHFWTTLSWILVQLCVFQKLSVSNLLIPKESETAQKIGWRPSSSICLLFFLLGHQKLFSCFPKSKSQTGWGGGQERMEWDACDFWAMPKSARNALLH